MQMNVSDSVSPALKMRPLTSEEIDSVVGGDTVFYGTVFMCNAYSGYLATQTGYTVNLCDNYTLDWDPVQGWVWHDHGECDGQIDQDNAQQAIYVLETWCQYENSKGGGS